MGHMDLQGDFKGLFLTGIFQRLKDENKTGLLQITEGKDVSKIIFEQGSVIYATSSEDETRLGYLLTKDDVISFEQLDKCLSLAKERKQFLGKILVDKGYLSLETLKKYNTKQAEQILFRLLHWEKGKYEFKKADLNLDVIIVNRLGPQNLLFQASRRIDEESVIKEQIPSDKLVFKMSDEAAIRDEKIVFNTEELAVFSLIDGNRSVKSIIKESDYDSPSVYKILYSVISCGLIQENNEILLGE